MKKSKFSIYKRLKSFKYAFNGFKYLFSNEHNSIIHLICALSAIILSIYFEINLNEWIAVIVAIGFVLFSEIFNTAVEKLSDFVSPEKNENIKVIKDLSAAGVLVSAITSLIIGIIIFLPKILNVFYSI